jgi:hypothetical protein
MILDTLKEMVSDIFFFKKPPPYTLAGFNLTTHCSSLIGSTRPRRQDVSDVGLFHPFFIKQRRQSSNYSLSNYSLSFIKLFISFIKLCFIKLCFIKLCFIKLCFIKLYQTFIKLYQTFIKLYQTFIKLYQTFIKLYLLLYQTKEKKLKSSFIYTCTYVPYLPAHPSKKILRTLNKIGKIIFESECEVVKCCCV